MACQSRPVIAVDSAAVGCVFRWRVSVACFSGVFRWRVSVACFGGGFQWRFEAYFEHISGVDESNRNVPGLIAITLI